MVDTGRDRLKFERFSGAPAISRKDAVRRGSNTRLAWEVIDPLNEHLEGARRMNSR